MIHRYRCSHSLPSRAATASLKEQKWLIADLFTSVLEVSYVNASSRAQRGVEGYVFVNINFTPKMMVHICQLILVISEIVHQFVLQD